MKWQDILKNLKQGLISLIVALISSFIFGIFINKYCITVYNANTGYSDPKMNNYYSSIAKFPILLPTIVFMVVNIAIYIYFAKKYRAFAITYLVITSLISILTVLFTETNVTLGI